MKGYDLPMARTSKPKSLPQNIVIHTTVSIDPAKLNPAPYNPRKISTRMINALKLSIRQRGFLQPLVVQKKGLVIIGGHQRLRAMRELCAEDNRPLPELPCVVLDIDDREAKKLNISLNRVGGEFDSTMLGTLLHELDQEVKMSDLELVSMGLDHEEFVDLTKGFGDELPPDDEEVKTFASSVTCSLAFTDVKKRDRVKKQLEERAKKEGKKTGDIVSEILRAR